MTNKTYIDKKGRRRFKDSNKLFSENILKERGKKTRSLNETYEL